MTMEDVCPTCGALQHRSLLSRIDAATALHFKDEKLQGFPDYFRWTGWKITQDTTLMVSQWVAGRKGGPYFYSSMPGHAGTYEPGECFDFSRQAGQEVLYLDHWEDEQAAIAKSIRIVAAGLARLREVIAESQVGV